MADRPYCDHPTWESSLQVTPIPGTESQLGMRHFYADIALRCAVCQTPAVTDGVPPPGVTTMAAGMLVRIKFLTLPATTTAPQQWVPVAPPPPPQEEPT